MAAHLFGYVGEVNDAQVAGRRRPEERRHRRPGRHREGLQRAADGRGRRQARRRQQRRPRDPDARGRRADRRQAAAADDRLRRPEGGRGRLQGVAGFNGAAVVLDPSNGDVLGVHQRAGLRPERVRRRHRPRDLGVAQQPTSCGRCNDRAIQGRYSPGSTFKMAVALAGARRRASSRRTSTSTAPATRTSTAATSSAGRRAATARSTCATPSSSRATSTSTRSPTWSASTRSTSGRRCSASA